jgi:hypothetical protein
MIGQAEYTRRILQSRTVWNDLLTRTDSEVQKLLVELDKEIEGFLKARGYKPYRKWHRGEIQKALQEMMEGFGGELSTSIQRSSDEVIEKYIEIHKAAGIELANKNNADPELVPASYASVNLDAVRGEIIRAYPDGLILSKRVWGLTSDASKVIERIIENGTLQGESAASLSKRLRLFVKGAKDFTREELLDLRGIRADLSDRAIKRVMKELGVNKKKGIEELKARARDRFRMGQSIASKAMRLAQTEINVAYHEASIVSAQNSAVVKGMKWELSRNHPLFDECDLLASANVYGLGKGVYPVNKVPHRPHPRCRCHMLDVLREPDEWDNPKPMPAMKADPGTMNLHFENNLTNKQKQRVRERFSELVKKTDAASRASATKK